MFAYYIVKNKVILIYFFNISSHMSYKAVWWHKLGERCTMITWQLINIPIYIYKLAIHPGFAWVLNGKYNMLCLCYFKKMCGLIVSMSSTNTVIFKKKTNTNNIRKSSLTIILAIGTNRIKIRARGLEFIAYRQSDRRGRGLY